MSAVGGEADVARRWLELPFLAKRRHSALIHMAGKQQPLNQTGRWNKKRHTVAKVEHPLAG